MMLFECSIDIAWLGSLVVAMTTPIQPGWFPMIVSRLNFKIYIIYYTLPCSKRASGG